MSVTNPSDSESELVTGQTVCVGEARADTAESIPATRRQKITAAALSVFGFLAFYLLSAGPIAGIHNVFKVRAFQKAVEVIYAPVVLLVKSNIEPFSSIMKWYVDLFR
jgi:hypothetical protein